MRVDSGSSRRGPVLRVEVGELRHDFEDDEADDHDRERDEHDRIDQRGHDVRTHRGQHFHVLDVAADHLLETAALLARHERGRVDAREQALRLERFRQRRARAHASVHVVERRAKRRIRHALAEDVQRLHERQPGLEQRGQLLIEDEEIRVRNLAAPRHGHPHAAQADAATDREQIEPFLLEFVTQLRFAFGAVRRFSDVARCGGHPTAEFHAIEAPPQRQSGPTQNTPALGP